MVVAGETAIETPDPTDVPPQLPEYHSQAAPVPKEPPETVNVVDWPGHVGFTLTIAAAAALEATVYVTLAYGLRVASW